ncbi:MAG: hypothetical protein II971_06770, partial [Firmicutes bacterium]|nr:hypothetical protein [Bacillota bacterium]
RVLDGVSTGSQAAPRGEIAQLIYNCLTKQIGTVGADGMWHGAMIADDADYTGEKVDTMLNRLGAELYNEGEYVLIDDSWIEDALADLSSYHGAVAQLYVNDDEEVVAIGDVLTTFITGKAVFEDGELTKIGDYRVAKTFDETNKKGQAAYGTLEILNGEEMGTLDELTSKKLIYAVELKGGKIAAVYSSQEWVITEVLKMTADDLEELKEDEPVIGKSKFALDDDDELDTSKFSIAGASALGDIEKNDVVYVYADSEGNVRKLEVSDEVVKGEFTKIRGRQKDDDEDRYYVAGKAYTLQTTANAKAAETLVDKNLGNEYTIYLGYDGKICFVEGEESSSSDYVVFLQYWVPGTGNADNRINKGKAGLSVFGIDGREELYFTKSLTADYEDEGYGYDETEYPIEAGTLVEITRDSKGNVSDIQVVGDRELEKGKDFTNFESKVTARGRVDKADAALQSSSAIYNYKGGEKGDKADDANYTVIIPSKLYKESTVKFDALARNSKGYVAAALIQGSSSTADDIVVLTGKIHTIKDAFEADLFMDGEKKTLIAADKDVFNKYVAPESAEEFEALVYTIEELNSDGEITVATPFEFTEENTIKLSTSAGIRIENDVIFGADDAPYEIEEGAVFYLYDYSDDKWSIVSENAVKGLKGDDNAKPEELKGGQAYAVRAIKTNSKHDGFDIFLIFRQ